MCNECYLDLASAIVRMAIWDYARNRGCRCEVLDFFRSSWGRFLCDHTGADPDRIVVLLLSLGDRTVRTAERKRVVAAALSEPHPQVGGCRRGRLMLRRRSA